MNALLVNDASKSYAHAVALENQQMGYETEAMCAFYKWALDV